MGPARPCKTKPSEREHPPTPRQPLLYRPIGRAISARTGAERRIHARPPRPASSGSTRHPGAHGLRRETPAQHGYDDVVAAARALGALGATLSGSGSAIVALADRSRVRPVAEAMTSAWGARGVGSVSFVSPPCPEGLQVQHHPDADSSSSAASAEHADAAHISNNEVTT